MNEKIKTFLIDEMLIPQQAFFRKIEREFQTNQFTLKEKKEVLLGMLVVLEMRGNVE